MDTFDLEDLEDLEDVKLYDEAKVEAGEKILFTDYLKKRKTKK